MYSKYLWGAILLSAALLLRCGDAAVQSGRANERRTVQQAAADDEDPQQRQTAAAAAAAADDEDQPRFKLVARRPLLQLQQRPTSAVQVDTERQPVIVVRQSPRLLQQQQRQRGSGSGQAAEDEDERRQPTVQQRAKEQPQHKEPVQTIRNYNKLNDDGSFTFGYESADGSFKEETRGTDCVVRGRYGYVDPDGNKREFSYVQGNPCDPNAVEDEDEDQPLKPGEAENVPDAPNVPINAARPKPAKKNRPTTTLFQQTFGDFEPQQQQQQQPLQQPSSTPRQPGRLQLQQPLQDISRGPAAPPQFRPPSAAHDDLESAIQNLPRPSAGRSQPQQAPAGPNSPVFTTELVFDPATGQFNTVVLQQVAKQQAAIDARQRLPPAPKLLQPKIQPPAQPQFQPQPIQFQPQPQFPQPQPQSAFPAFQPQFGAQPPQFRAAVQQPFLQFQSQRSAEFDFQKPDANGPQQQRVQQQQALTIQQSQNLFRQQQKQQQQQHQPFQSQFFPPRLPEQQTDAQQQFVFVQPGRTPSQQNLAVGQIDAFLRGHNVQF